MNNINESERHEKIKPKIYMKYTLKNIVFKQIIQKILIYCQHNY